MANPKVVYMRERMYSRPEAAQKLYELGKVKTVVPHATMNLWLQRGLFPGAYLSGHAWQIPESDILNFQKPPDGRGRMPVLSEDDDDATPQKRRARAA